jgi:hypothetical protein
MVVKISSARWPGGQSLSPQGDTMNCTRCQAHLMGLWIPVDGICDQCRQEETSINCRTCAVQIAHGTPGGRCPACTENHDAQQETGKKAAHFAALDRRDAAQDGAGLAIPGAADCDGEEKYF